MKIRHPFWRRSLWIGLLFFWLTGPFYAQEDPWKEYPARSHTGWANALEQIFSSRDSLWPRLTGLSKGSGLKPFERTRYFWQDYAEAGIDPSESWSRALNRELTSRPATDRSNWQLLGETAYTRTGGMEGKGRINVIVVDPTDPDVIYAGAPAGGLWKTVDGGATWMPLTDELAAPGVSGIALDPLNPQVIYIGTGDDDAWQGPSRGMFKSTDGGRTWQHLTLPVSGSAFVSDIVIPHGQSSVIVAATSHGVWRSSDAGATWQRVLDGRCRNLRLHPSDPQILYAATENPVGFYRSADGGQTWQQVTRGLPLSGVDRMVMDVTPADPSRVYVFAKSGNTFEGFYVSRDSGLSFTRTAETDNLIDSRQSWYDLEIGVSDTNPDLIFKGELNLMISTDGGDSFTTHNSWYVEDERYTHADIHFIRYFNGVLYVGTDGGIYKSTDDGLHFTPLHDGMAVSQVYRLSVGKNSDVLPVYGGLQDNGGIAKRGSTWNIYHGGDGMDNAADPRNPFHAYSLLYYGYSGYETFDGGISGRPILQIPEMGSWVVPVAVDMQGRFYAATYYLYRLDGNSWTRIQQAGFSDPADVLTFDPADSTRMWAGVLNNLYVSRDGGQSFSLLHTFFRRIKSVAKHATDDTLWVAVFDKVWKYAGGSWSDVSAGLPRGVRVNKVVYHPYSDPPVLYAGTDLGVYRKEGDAPWELFSNGLPRTLVYDLEVDETAGYLYAATFGRSVWVTPVNRYPAERDLAVGGRRTSGTYGCDTVHSLSVPVVNAGLQDITSFDYSWNDGIHTFSGTRTGVLRPGDTAFVDLVLDWGSARGSMTGTFSVSVPGDRVPGNNTRVYSFFVNMSGMPGMYLDFESDAHTLATASTRDISEWELAVPSGTVLGSAASGQRAYCTDADGRYSNTRRDYLYLPCLDFSGYRDLEISFDLAFDIENNWDALYMEYSVDGYRWYILGSASDPSWYNNSSVQGACVGGQWSGTDATFRTYSHSLDFLSGEPRVYLRFVMASDNYVTGEGAVVDNLRITGTLGAPSAVREVALNLYPNPSDGEVTLESSEPVTAVEWISPDGQLIFRMETEGARRLYFNTSSLAKGMYLWRIYWKDGVRTVPFIKR
ncbi:MAG: T9SS type A sorting domain-containing protein [Chlorobi bacterium]|nr:T9SS type A sorting domain-containing protein [Chlorobiota bacterium]